MTKLDPMSDVAKAHLLEAIKQAILAAFQIGMICWAWMDGLYGWALIPAIFLGSCARGFAVALSRHLDRRLADVKAELAYRRAEAGIS